MSKELGPLTYGKKEEQIFLGREIAQHQDYSEETAVRIDQEVKKLILEGYSKAEEILKANREPLVRLAEALLEYETLDRREIEAVVKGEPMKAREEPKPASPEESEAQPEKSEREEEKTLPSLVKPNERPAPA